MKYLHEGDKHQKKETLQKEKTCGIQTKTERFNL